MNTETNFNEKKALQKLGKTKLSLPLKKNIKILSHLEIKYFVL